MLAAPWQLFRGLPPPVRLLVAGTFVNRLGTLIGPYLSLVLQRDFHLKATTAGALLAAHWAGSLVSILVGGLLTDRLGRRRTLLLSLLGSGALAVGMAFAPSVAAFVVLLLVFGFLADLYRPAANAMVADLLPSSDRVTGFAALRMAVNLGFAAGVAAGGVLAELSWRLLFVGDGVTTVLFGLIVYAFVAETAPLSDDMARRETAAAPIADPTYLQLSATAFAFAVVFINFVTVLPLTVTLAAGYPATVYGALMAVNGLVVGLFEMTAVAWLRRFRRLRVAALGLLVTGLGFALTGLSMHWGFFLFTLLLWTAGEILTSPQQVAFAADWAPPAQRGRYLAFFAASSSLGFVVNPLLFLPLQARLGDRAFWPLMLLIVAPAALVSLRLDRTADRPERLAGLTAPAGAAPG